MHLVSALIAGVKGAENGYAFIYARGTTALATYYPDYDGTGGLACPSTGIALDANGSAKVYVDQQVEVVVKDSESDELVRWVEMVGANNIEVRSSAFTGTDYSGGASAVSKPVTLTALLNKWITSAGTDDFDVLLEGAVSTLQAALGRLAGPAWFNVRDPSYGATGDGSTDDKAAIQLAIDACNTAGGGVVYFPEGTYKISATLSISSKVCLLGASSGRTYIKTSSATAATLTFTGGGDPQFVKSLVLQPSVANTGNIVTMSASININFYDCSLGDTALADGDLVNLTATTHYMKFHSCIFAWHSSTVSAISSAATAGRLVCDNGCIFQPPAACSATNGWIYADHVDLIGCLFKTGTSTSGTCSVYKAVTTTLDATIIGCKFETSGGATVTGMTLGTYVAASRFVENDNIMPGQADTNFTAYSYTVSAAQHTSSGSPVVILGTRTSRTYITTNSNGAFSAPTDQYGVIVVTVSNAGATTHTPVMAPVGSRGIYWVKNAAVGAQDSTPAAPFLTVANKNIGAGLANMMRYEAIVDPTPTNYLVNTWVA